MQQRTETSPDGELVLTVRQAGDDWIIAFVGSGWHTHPECITPFKPNAATNEEAVRDYVDCILEDRSIIVVTTRGDHRDVIVLDPDIDFTQYDPPTREAALQAQIESDTRCREPGERMTYRLWSGEPLS